MSYMDLLRQGFNEHVALHEKRPGIQKLVAPLFHEDGDMVDIFLESLEGGHVRVSDKGLSLMRLSYGYDLDTTNKERIFRRILDENKIAEDRGMLFLDVPESQIYPAVLHFGQTVAKITNMALYRREVIANLFYEMLQETVTDTMSDLKPQENVLPIPQRAELAVDFSLQTPTIPIFLFGVKERDTSKLRLAALSCLQFQLASLRFRSVIVHQDFSALSQKDQAIITNAADKQFTSLDEFATSGRQAIDRLAA
ncbi:MAG: DUF1828 domain-containing protein [Pseudomonadota bacterium]|jgi:hypothetical protein